VDELADAVAVDRLEGVDRENLDFPLCAWLHKAIDVFEQELALGVVTAETKPTSMATVLLSKCANTFCGV